MEEESKLVEKPPTDTFTDKSVDTGMPKPDLQIVVRQMKNDEEAQLLTRKGLFTRYKGGVLSRDGRWVYHIGIIDILTKYTVLKKAETVLRYFTGKALKKISAVPPRMYRKRMIKFMNRNI